MSRCAQRLAVGLLACAGACSVTRPGHAQSREAVLPVRPFGVRDVDGWIEFEYENEHEERVLRSGAQQRSEDRREFSEAIWVNTRSYIYHPYFADIQFGIGARVKQGQRDISPSSAAASEGEDLFADTIRADVTFLKRKPVVTHLFYHRDVLEYDPEGFGSFEVDTNRYGGMVQVRHPDWPMNFSVTRQTDVGLGANPQDETLVDTSFTVSNETGPLSSELSLGYSDRQDNFRSTTDEITHGDLRQALRFGSRDQHLWLNDLRFFDQTGTLERSQRVVHEELRSDLTDRWSSRVQGDFEQVDFETDSLQTWSALGELRHQLYESLITTGSVWVQDSSTDVTNTTIQQGDLDFRYRKNIPGGTFTGGVHLRYLTSQEESTGTTQLVTDESQTFGAGPVLLNNPNVVVGTVVITDPTSLITYIQGIDYLLLPRGLLTEVVRLATGAIPAAGGILVDYQFTVSPNLEYDSLGAAVDGRLALWNWLALYGQYSQDDRTVTKGESLSRIQDQFQWLIGAQVNYDGFTATGELESFDSGLTQFQRQHLRLDYTDVLYRDWHAFGSAGWTLTSFDVSNEDITTVDIRVGARGTLVGRIHAEADAWLRTEDGRKLSPDTDERGVRATLVWRHRQVQARLSVVSALLEDAAGQRQQRQEVSVSVRRDF